MLNSILNNMGADNSAPMEVHTVNQEEILQFKCNPLAVVILHTELQSTLDDRDYSDVFEDEGSVYLGYNSKMLTDNLSLEPEFESTFKLAEEIIQYFKDLLGMKILKGEMLGGFEDALQEFLKLSDNNQAKIKHLPMVVKLQEFYLAEQNLLVRSEQLVSIESNKTDQDEITTSAVLTPISVWDKFTKREKKDDTFLHFKTSKNQLVEYKARKSDILFELFKSEQFKQIELNVDLYGSLVTHPITGFTHLRADTMDVKD